MKEYPKCFSEINLERIEPCEKAEDFLLSYFIPKNKVTALMCSTPAPEGIARTETAVVMTALSKAKRILFISLTEDTDVIEKNFRTLPYEYTIKNLDKEFQEKHISVCGKDKNPLLFFTETNMEVNGNFFNYLFYSHFDLVVIDDIVEILEEKKVSIADFTSRKLIKNFIFMAEQIKTAFLFTADTRYSDHAMLSLPCSVIDVKKQSILDKKETERTKAVSPFFPFADYEIFIRNEKNDCLFDTNLHEYGNWISLSTLCELICKNRIELE